jgi:monofunctional biosynthetic peptidoglycan transglycosylase
VIYKFVPVPFTPLMVIRAIENSADKKETHSATIGSLLRIFLSTYRRPLLQVKTEVSLFTTDLILKRCIKGNERGRKIKGGSHIATNKKTFLWQGRSLQERIEAYFTVLIEFIWGKERIMEVY